MATGRVKWFSETKGFGFIEDGGGRDIYVHYTAIDAVGTKALPDGALVHYEIIETQQGPEAANVRVQERI